VTELSKELKNTDAQQLIPCTILGALHRKYKRDMTPYDSWGVMHNITTMEQQFVADLRVFHNDAIDAFLSSMQTEIRAWPVCIRPIITEHIRSMVARLDM
jgi:hypothetical protein